MPALLRKLLARTEALLQACFQCEVLLRGCQHHRSLGGRLSLPEPQVTCPGAESPHPAHWREDAIEMEGGLGVCDPHLRSQVLAGAHLPCDGRRNLAERAWDGQSGNVKGWALFVVS